MIRHIVLLRFLPEIGDADRAALIAAVGALRGHLAGIVGFGALANVSPEEPVVHGFRDGFAVDFVDAGARDAYLEDAAHRAIGERLVAACGGLDGLVVFDHAL